MNNSDEKGNMDDRAWKTFREQFEVGQLVEGIVVEHRPFGTFVDIGSPRFLALVELPSMESMPGSRPGSKEVLWPAIGSRIEAVFLGFANPDGRQPRLLARQKALQAAVALQQVTNLPVEKRGKFLHQALDALEPDVASAAVWQVKYLPSHERGVFLRRALSHPDASVAARAVQRVVDLPVGEQAAFLELAVQHRDIGVAKLAVRQAEHLSMRDRAMFLQVALQYPAREVVERAQSELKRLSHDDSVDG